MSHRLGCPGQFNFDFLFRVTVRQVVVEECIPGPTKLRGGIRLGYASEIQEKSYCAFLALIQTTFSKQQLNGVVPLEYHDQRVVYYLNNLIRGATKLWLDISSGQIHHSPLFFSCT